MTHLRSLAFALTALTLLACGGATEPTDGAGGGASGGQRASGGHWASGGFTTPLAGGSGAYPGVGGRVGAGGTPGSGGARASGGGTPGAGGAIQGSGGAVVCCLAIPTCDAGDAMIGAPEKCPPDTSCYSRSVCCSTIWCAHPNAQCNAYPSCNWGDKEISGTCPPNSLCYQSTLCGNTITCVSLGTGGSGGASGVGGSAGTAGAGGAAPACDPTAEYNKHYASTDVGKCALLDFACPMPTKYFANDCGCGCEQDPSCPEWVNCMPGTQTLSDLCTDSGHARCPYTLRAY